jgi:phenylpropionate dioxygenase-like ring-hydroxylating dioxygenase large terminal subunit
MADPGIVTRGWFAVALSSEITAAPREVWLHDTPWVLLRDADDRLRAFVDQCPHRAYPLSAGTLCADGTLQCGYHGWRFDMSGACVAIPALDRGAPIPSRANLPAAAGIMESGGIVWMAPSDTAGCVPDMTAYADGFEVGVPEPGRADVDPGMMIDNFLDVAHFPFVHRGTFATEGSGTIEQYEIERAGAGFTAITEHEFNNHEDAGVTSGLRPLLQRRRMTYRYHPPYTATLRLDYLDYGGVNMLLFAVQPERGRTCRIYTVMFRDDLTAEAMAHAVAFEEKVLEEDLAVQRRIRTRLPLATGAEVHTKADRVTIELRRALAEFASG